MDAWGGDDVDELVRCLHELGVVVPFDRPSWYSPDRYPAGRGLESAPAADTVRLLASCSRGDRSSNGALVGGLDDGSVPAAVGRLWSWYRQAVAGDHEFVDHAEYSADGVYRWSCERRWAPGGAPCWVGLNPGTGDRDSGPRPTLRKVVAWAKREGCAALSVMNPFSYRSTDPKALRRTAHAADVVGERTDEAIRAASRAASRANQVTLVAWGRTELTGVAAQRWSPRWTTRCASGSPRTVSPATRCSSRRRRLSPPTGGADDAARAPRVRLVTGVTGHPRSRAPTRRAECGGVGGNLASASVPSDVPVHFRSTKDGNRAPWRSCRSRGEHETGHAVTSLRETRTRVAAAAIPA